VAEPLKLQNPFSRIVAVRRGLVHGLAEVLYPDHIATVDGRPAFNHFYPRGGNAFEQNKRLGPVADTLITKRPGLYSGEMRKVVQDNLARGLDIPYEFSFFLTHGIFTAADGSKHIVEISNSGIFTWPLRTRDLIAGASEDTHLATLDYIPLRTERPQNPTQIADASLLSEAYAESPWYSEQGWAFSGSGAKAVNVTVAAGVQPFPLHLHTRQWELTITETNNAPSSAAIQEIASGYVWSPKVSGYKALLKVPAYVFGDPVCVKFDINYGLLAGPTATGSPIHSWYEGEVRKEAQFWYHDNVFVDDETVIDPWTPPQTSGPGSPDPNSILSSSGWGVWDANKRQSCFSSPVLGETEAIDKTGNEFTRGFAASGHLAGDLVVLREERRIGMVRTQGNTDCLVIPLNEREGVFHIREIVTRESMNEFVRVMLEGWSGHKDAAGLTDPCLSGCPPIIVPLGYRLYDVDQQTDAHYMINQSTSTVDWFFEEPKQPAGWQPCPACGTPEWMFDDQASDFTSDAVHLFSLPEAESRAYSGGARVDGSNHGVDLSVASAGAWLRDSVGSEEVAQIVLAAVDQNSAVEAIISQRPYPDFSPLGATLTGGASYPTDELERALLAWIGNP